MYYVCATIIFLWSNSYYSQFVMLLTINYKWEFFSWQFVFFNNDHERRTHRKNERLWRGICALYLFARSSKAILASNFSIKPNLGSVKIFSSIKYFIFSTYFVYCSYHSFGSIYKLNWISRGGPQLRHRIFTLCFQLNNNGANQWRPFIKFHTIILG